MIKTIIASLMAVSFASCASDVSTGMADDSNYDSSIATPETACSLTCSSDLDCRDFCGPEFGCRRFNQNWFGDCVPAAQL